MLLATVDADIRINEFVASNRSGLVDEDGDYSDWIEIYNAGPDAVDFADWSLTDDAQQPNKWVFTSNILQSEGYLVVFASGKDRAEDETRHTNFKLSSEGEFLGLSNPQGELVSALTPTFPSLSRDISYGFDTTSMAFRYWRSPTPGSINREDPSLGPLLSAPEKASLLAKEGVDFVVSVQIIPNGAPIESVTLKQRAMFKGEGSVPLKDDGRVPDEVAGDGRYTGKITANTLFGKRYRAGEMLRWAFLTRDSDGYEARLPHVREDTTAQPEYLGTIVEDPTIESPLPVLHWFAESPDQAARPTGSRASAYFDGQFYDNVFVKRRGQSGAIGWPKPKLKFDFNPQDHFRYDPERRLVEEFNLQSHFNDASFMRENVAFAFFNEIGTPASDTRHWHVRLNGGYYGLFSFVEQVDQDFLRQQGLDPDGTLYKANGFPSTLAVGVTSELYQKDTNKDEPYDDLIAFVDGINGEDRFQYIMDNVNLPALVNAMAGQSVLRNHDRLTKNYYLYRDPTTDLWERIPWDMDATFSTGNANENFASPLYGDSEHTQAPNQKIYQNFLLDAILDHKPTRQMYLRRLRTLIDTYLTEDAIYFSSNIDRRLDLIRRDAIADKEEWRTGTIDNGARAIKETALPLRRRELLETFGKGLVPAPATSGLKLIIGNVDATPEDPKSEYIQIVNPNNEAIDLTGWTVAGAVRFEFPPGTVIPKNGGIFSPGDGIMYVVRNVRSFRRRTTGPSAEQGMFFVGPYEGKLSSRGEAIQILDQAGQLIVEHRYEGTAITYELWAQDRFSDEQGQQDAVSGWAADPDGTGLSNLHRYAFGDALRFQVEEPSGLSYFRASNTSDLEYVIETSSDLITWKEVPNLMEQAVEAADGFEKLSISLLDRHERFYRVRVQLSD